MLATGRAISNLARNWKYCSSVCWVNPVPTNSICTTDIIIDITTGSQYQNYQEKSDNHSFFSLKCQPTLRSSTRITPFLATDWDDLRCMILSRHSDSHTGHRKYRVHRPWLVSEKCSRFPVSIKKLMAEGGWKKKTEESHKIFTNVTPSFSKDVFKKMVCGLVWLTHITQLFFFLEREGVSTFWELCAVTEAK